MNVDPTDPRFDGFRRLNESGFRRVYEKAEGVFIAEGPTVVSHVMSNAGSLVDALMVDVRMRDRVPPGLDIPVHLVDQSFISAVVGFEFHRGMLALCHRPPMSTVAHMAGLDSLAVLEGVNDHANLGAIIRAAAGLGVGGLVLDPTSADPWYRRSVRVSMGAVVDIPMARAVEWPADLDGLTAGGLTLVAATPDASSIDVAHAPRLLRPAVLLGAEGPGLTAAVLAKAAVRVRIPMQRAVDSLNVGQAAAILFDRMLTRP